MKTSWREREKEKWEEERREKQKQRAEEIKEAKRGWGDG